ncbi:MAG: pyruvate kinase alpha/beta domain-containing protein [Eubacteriales bacterium]
MYWETRGKNNTGATVSAALRRAGEAGIKHIVVASNTGNTAGMFLPLPKDLQLVCVTHQVGYHNPGEDEISPEARKELAEKGVKVLTTTHLMGGLDRACRNKFGGVYPAEIIASALRMFGQGVKVCVEVSVMALDAGLIPAGADIIAVGGTARGADTAVIIVPAHSQNFFDTKIKEIICKPL